MIVTITTDRTKNGRPLTKEPDGWHDRVETNGVPAWKREGFFLVFWLGETSVACTEDAQFVPSYWEPILR